VRFKVALASCIIVALSGSFLAGLLFRPDEQAITIHAACVSSNENKRVISDILDVLGGPGIIEPVETRRRVVRLLEPIDC